jgi:lysophospholipase L1-like esterase
MTGSRRVRAFALTAAAVVAFASCDRAAEPRGEPSPNLTPVPAAPVARDPCAAPQVGHPLTVALVRRPDGTCVPFGRTFLYRCDPTLPAVAVVDSGQGIRRFLGGSYGVPVAAVPSTALTLGVTPFGEVFEDPADPSFVWMQADGVTRRWLAIPNANKLSAPPTVQLIGDSILDGGQDEVVAGLPMWSATVDAEIGRGSYGAATVAEWLPSPAADAVVIEIGVNDADVSATIAGTERIVAAQGDARLLVWLTAHGPETAVPAVNQTIVDAMGAIPNGAVLDWDRLVPLDALSSDGVHPDAGQQGVLASMLDPYLQTWLDAVSGAGPTACESTIRTAA